MAIKVHVDQTSTGITESYFNLMAKMLSKLRRKGGVDVRFNQFARSKYLSDDQSRYFLAMLIGHGYVTPSTSIDDPECLYAITEKALAVLPPPEDETVPRYTCRHCLKLYVSKDNARACERRDDARRKRAADAPKKWVRGPQFNYEFSPVGRMDAGQAYKRARWK